MKVFGLYKETKSVWVVYTTINKSKYFIGAYRTEEKAKEMANKYSGKYFYKEG